MKRRPRLTTPGRVWLVFAFALIGLAVVGMTRIPTVRSVLIWRVEVARAQVLDWWSGRSDTLPTPSADAVVRRCGALTEDSFGFRTYKE